MGNLLISGMQDTIVEHVIVLCSSRNTSFDIHKIFVPVTQDKHVHLRLALAADEFIILSLVK